MPHSHVVKCMTVELPDVLDEWASVGDYGSYKSPRDAGTITPHYVGGRDWVVTIIHPDHDFPRSALAHEDTPAAHGVHVGRRDRLAKHGDDSREALASVGGGFTLSESGDLAASTVSGARILIGDEAISVGEDGIARMQVAQVGPVRAQVTAMGTGDGAMVEDADRTWALWVDDQGRPASMWLRRGEDGAVEGPGLGFDGDRLFTVDDTRTPYPPDYDTEQEITPGERVAQRQIESAAEAYHDAVAALAEVRPGPLSTTIGYLIRQRYLIPAEGGEWVEASEVRVGDTVALHRPSPTGGRMAAVEVSEITPHGVEVRGLGGTYEVLQFGTASGGFVRYATEPVLRVRQGH